MLNTCPNYEYGHYTGDDSGDPADPIDTSVGAQNTSIPLTLTWVGLSPAPGSLPAGTEHSQGGM